MIYAICGKKRSGKDTVADFVVGQYKGVESIALADKIKSILLNGMSVSSNRYLAGLSKTHPFYGDDRESPLVMSNNDAYELFKFGIKYLGSKLSIDSAANDTAYQLCKANKEPWTIRRLMQVFGTDVVCASNNLIWTQVVIEKILKSNDNHFIITDVRQEHEYKYLSKLGVKFVFLERDTGEEGDSHSTEKGLTPRPNDIIIVNNGTLDDLHREVLKTFNF